MFQVHRLMDLTTFNVQSCSLWYLHCSGGKERRTDVGRSHIKKISLRNFNQLFSSTKKKQWNIKEYIKSTHTLHE